MWNTQELTKHLGGGLAPTWLVGGEHSHHSTFPAPHILIFHKFGLNTDTKLEACCEKALNFKISWSANEGWH